jgi:hypothetical protein
MICDFVYLKEKKTLKKNAIIEKEKINIIEDMIY